jgi:hypothetical protein
VKYLNLELVAISHICNNVKDYKIKEPISFGAAFYAVLRAFEVIKR